MRLLSLLVALLCTALPGPAAAAGARPPLVATANTILEDLVRQIGGEQVRIHCLLEPGADPHTFEPRPADVKLLVGADLLVVNGLNLEPAILKLAQNCGFKGPIIVATAGLTPRTGGCTHDHHRHEHTAACTHGTSAPSENRESTTETRPTDPQSAFRDPHSSSPDPHAWQSPAAVKTYVANLREALARAHPAAAAHYAERAAAYLAQLDALDRWIREQVAAIPAVRRKLVTSHDSLGYYADAYGFETIPVAGLSSSAEPDARAVAAIIDLIRREQVPAVFFELTTNPKLVRQIGADAGVRLAEPLFTDSLGAPGSGAETYLDLIRTNTNRIVAALR